MKKIFAATLLSFALLSCTDTKIQEKDLLNEVIKTHDRVMAKDELIMTNKMQLDTLKQTVKSPEVNAKVTELQAQLTAADTKMEDWMHNFDAENKGKSHDEIMVYLIDQKKQIESIDKQLNDAVAASSTFIKATKSK